MEVRIKEEMQSREFWTPSEQVLKRVREGLSIDYLFLFDIDGTLLFTPTVHRNSFIAAFKEIFNIEINVDWQFYSGRTDSWIITDIAIKNGLNVEELNRKLTDVMNSMYKWYSENVKDEDGTVIEGVPEFLKMIDEHGYLRGLVTGNVEGIAYEKTKFYKLEKGFALGGFGNEHIMRDELLKKAVKRATDLYGFQPKTDLSNVIYIADTPHDVVAARKANIRCIVPYNGINNKRDWSQNEPELFINSLKEGNKIFEYLERK